MSVGRCPFTETTFNHHHLGKLWRFYLVYDRSKKINIKIPCKNLYNYLGPFNMEKVCVML